MRITLTALTLCVALVSTFARRAKRNLAPPFARHARGQDPRRLGGADDRRFVRRAHRVSSNGKIIEGNLNKYLDWSPERLKNAIDQDDLYVEMTFAEVMDKVGLDATTEQYGEMFKDSQVRPVARQRRRPAQSEPRHQGPDVGQSEVQRPRQRHRLPDRVGLHRPHDSRPSPRGQQVRRPRGPGDELRRRPVRRHVLLRHVRRRFLRDRPAQGRGAGPSLDSGGERLRKGHPRRAPLVGREPRRLDARPGTSSRTSGTRPTPARTARWSPSTSTPS